VKVAKVEGFSGLGGKARMLRNALQNTRLVSSFHEESLQVWPTLGYFEVLFWRNKSLCNYILFHDPIPLRKQFGMGMLAKSLTRLVENNSPTVLVHSSEAYKDMRMITPWLETKIVYHPIRSQMKFKPDTSFLDPPIVSIIGQFKPTRSLKLIEDLGPLLLKHGIKHQIYGRGWPKQISSWNVNEGFITESRLDKIIENSSLVIIPYDRFYQSNIAVRCVELGTTVIAPRNSFVELLLGNDSTQIVSFNSAENYLISILDNLEMDHDFSRTFETYRTKVNLSWSQLKL
jgi:hypothetical protein